MTLTEAEKAETEAFVAKYLADKEANKVFVDQRSIDHVLGELSKLRVSNAELLVALKEVHRMIIPGVGSISTLATCSEILKAAIANAEKL